MPLVRRAPSISRYNGRLRYLIPMRSTLLLLFTVLCGCGGTTDTSRQVNSPSNGGTPTRTSTALNTGGAPVQLGSNATSVGGITSSGGTTSTVDSTSNTDGSTLAASGGALGTGGSTNIAASGSTGTSVRACKGTSSSIGNGSCHTTKDCSSSWYKCCTGTALASDCWGPGACPLPPTQCQYLGNRVTCANDSDCGDAGTCEKGQSGCPVCPFSQCKYPAPKCSQSPDSCGADARCQADGTCQPLRCDAGYACADGSRCNVESTRADAHGCELIPCNDGWSCEENTRCVVPVSATSHGCNALQCAADTDCDCGYCVNGSCKANLGYCTAAPS